MDKKSVLLSIAISFFFCDLIAQKANIHASERDQQTIVLATGYAEDSPIYQRLSILYTEAFRRIGYQFKLARLPKERALRAANSGEFDGDASRIKALEDQGSYPNLIRVDFPVLHSLQVAFASDKNLVVKNWQDIKSKGLIIGYPRGQVYSSVEVEKNHLPPGNVVVVNECSQVIQMLISGRINVYVDNQGNCLNQRSQYPSIHIAGVLATTYGYPYIHKKHRDIIEKLRRALKDASLDPNISRKLSDIDRASQIESLPGIETKP